MMTGQVSYSLHLSKGSHALTNINKVGQADRHNLRKYKSDKYDRSKIEVLAGSDKSILDSVKDTYQLFEPARKKYNKGKQKSRQIKDYMKYVSEGKADVAAELIIQIGDKDFWEGKTDAEKQQTHYIFEDQLRTLKKLAPDFKVSSAVVHYDESSPHMHVIGVPVATGYVRGMEMQCAKTKVFTKDSLTYLQDKMRENAEKGMNLPANQNLFADVMLKPKEKGRNKDIPKYALDEYYAIKAEAKKAREERLEEEERAAKIKEEWLETEEKTKKAQEKQREAEEKTVIAKRDQLIAEGKAMKAKEKKQKLTAENKDLYAKNVQYNKDKKNFESKIEELTGQEEQLKSRVESLTGQEEQLKSSVENLAGQENQLKSSVGNLAGQEKDLRTSIDDLEKQKIELTADVDARLKKDIPAWKKAIDKALKRDKEPEINISGKDKVTRIMELVAQGDKKDDLEAREKAVKETESSLSRRKQVADDTDHNQEQRQKQLDNQAKEQEQKQKQLEEMEQNIMNIALANARAMAQEAIDEASKQFGAAKRSMQKFMQKCKLSGGMTVYDAYEQENAEWRRKQQQKFKEEWGLDLNMDNELQL